ncbi:MAG: glycosyltransferase, partial [Psychrosphaera sp.]|nr:glycosyltransferase [Psychrosphaera sp.]
FPVLSETFVSTEMRAMERCGHEIQPIAFNHHDGQYQSHDSSLKERTIYLCDHSNALALKALPLLKSSLFKGLKFALRQRGIPIKSLLGNALKLAYVAKQTGCTHFHAHFSQSAAATAIVAARLCGVTVSFVGHEHDIYASPQDLSLKLNAVDFAVAVCLDMAHHFNSLAPQANTSLIYCGVETERFNSSGGQQPMLHNDPSQNKPSQNSPPENTNNGKLLFIGRLSETKGLFTLFNALHLIDRSIRPTLDIVGDGVLRGALKRHVVELGLTEYINFLGTKQSTWLIENARHYAAMVAPFEMADSGDRDSGPVVIKEAMALKLAVITTYFMGCKEMLTLESGLRVQPKDEAALAQIITRFYTMSSQEVDTMVENAYERVNNHNCADLQAICLSTMVEMAG